MDLFSIQSSTLSYLYVLKCDTNVQSLAASRWENKTSNYTAVKLVRPIFIHFFPEKGNKPKFSFTGNSHHQQKFLDTYSEFVGIGNMLVIQII